jgi:hypothetical protein
LGKRLVILANVQGDHFTEVWGQVGQTRSRKAATDYFTGFRFSHQENIIRSIGDPILPILSFFSVVK